MPPLPQLEWGSCRAGRGGWACSCCLVPLGGPLAEGRGLILWQPHGWRADGEGLRASPDGFLGSPDEDDPAGQEVEADQHMGPEVTEVPEVILYSSTEEEEEEEEDEEAAAGEEEEGEEEAPPGVVHPPEPLAPLFVLEVEEGLPLEGGETPPPSPLPPPWTQERRFPLSLPVWKGPPPIKRSSGALEDGEPDQTSLLEPEGQPPCKKGRPGHQLQSSISKR